MNAWRHNTGLQLRSAPTHFERLSAWVTALLCTSRTASLNSHGRQGTGNGARTIPLALRSPPRTRFRASSSRSPGRLARKLMGSRNAPQLSQTKRDAEPCGNTLGHFPGSVTQTAALFKFASIQRFQKFSRVLPHDTTMDFIAPACTQQACLRLSPWRRMAGEKATGQL